MLILTSLSALLDGNFLEKIQNEMIADENRKIIVTMNNLLPRHCETFILIDSFEFARSQCYRHSTVARDVRARVMHLSMVAERVTPIHLNYLWLNQDSVNGRV